VGQDGIDLSKNTLSLQRLREAVEVAKIELSSLTETEINLPFISADTNGNPKHLKMKISRAKYNQLVQPLIDVCRVRCTRLSLALWLTLIFSLSLSPLIV